MVIDTKYCERCDMFYAEGEIHRCTGRDYAVPVNNTVSHDAHLGATEEV